MEKFIKNLNLNKSGHYENNKYIIDLSDSNEYSKMYTLLDNSSILSLDPESTQISESSSMLIYNDDDFKYDIKLSANYNQDEYKVIISEIK